MADRLQLMMMGNSLSGFSILHKSPTILKPMPCVIACRNDQKQQAFMSGHFGMPLYGFVRNSGVWCIRLYGCDSIFHGSFVCIHLTYANDLAIGRFQIKVWLTAF